MAKVELLGLEKVKRELDQIAPRMQKNILRGAVRKVAAEIRDDARNNVPRKSGTLARNIISKSRRGRRGIIRASVIVRTTGGRDGGTNAFYWRFVEFGHIFRSGKQVPGTASFTRAFEGILPRVDQILTTYIRPRIERVLKKR